MVSQSAIEADWNDDVVYSDDYVDLSINYLRIKKYYFPTLKKKYLRVQDIKVVYFESQENAKYALRRTWGLIRENDVYWAADFGR